MKKYAKNTQLEPAGQQAWLSIQLATTIMKGIDGPVTAESFIAAVDATTDIPTLGGKLPSGQELPGSRGDLSADLQQRLLGAVEDHIEADRERKGREVHACTIRVAN